MNRTQPLACKLKAMAIPAEITVLIERLNQELDQTSQSATEGLSIVRSRLLRKTCNAILIQLFASKFACACSRLAFNFLARTLTYGSLNIL